LTNYKEHVILNVSNEREVSKMNEKFKGMMDDIIRKFGFEDIHTIIFCGMCERADVPLNSIYETYDEYMSLDIMLDE
jgi:hypothetical protein